MEAHHVSAMEGGRACAVVAIWMPLAFIAGAVIGLVVGLLIKRQGFAGYALKQGISLAAIVELEARDRRATHIRKADAIVQSKLAECTDNPIDLVEKLSA